MKDQAIDLAWYITFMSFFHAFLMASLNVKDNYDDTTLTLHITKWDFQIAVDKVIQFAAFCAFR